MNQPDPAEIEAIAARTEAATPGPWLASHESVSDIHGFDCQSQVTYPDGHGNYGFTPADAEFIAHARQDIPTLLAALATAEQERDQARRYAIEYERAWEAAEAVIKAAQDVYRFGVANTGGSTTVQNKHFAALRDAVANYHKATGPQAENEEDDEGG